MTAISPPDDARNYALLTSDDASASWLDVPFETLLATYKRYGALVLRGYLGSRQDDFAKLCDQFCSSYLVNVSGGRATIDADTITQTVNLGDDPFPLHPEMSHKPWRPDIAFFWCVSSPSEGGETTLCDGVALAKALPKELYDLFEQKGLLYKGPIADEWLYAHFGSPDAFTLWKQVRAAGMGQYFKLGDDGTVEQDWPAPAIYKPAFIDEPAFANFVLFSRKYNASHRFPFFGDGALISDAIVDEIDEVSAKLTRAIDWRPHDLVIVDNTRFMHGRRKILDQGERLIMTRFGYLNEGVRT